MNKPLLAILISFVFFAVGLTATYFAMPAIAPALVDRVQHRLDSLATASMEIDAPAAMTLPADSLTPPDSSAEMRLLEGLRDSLHALVRQLDTERSNNENLLDRVESMEQRWDELGAKYDEARQMSSTVTKMEDRELSELLSKLDDAVIESMYIEASARNRARLLQMLPAEKAATLVNRLTDPSFSMTSDSNPENDQARQ